MQLKDIFENNQRWVAEKLKVDNQYFARMAGDQHPQLLYIGCSDSRVSAEELMGLAPGQVFVHRNIANMVPNTDLSVMSVIKYAVNILKVQDIVVCGHYNCGGVKAAMESKDLGLLNPWLRNIRDVYRLHQKELIKTDDVEQRYRRLVELNVLEQCVNVTKTAVVQRAYKERGLKVHGWVFDIHTGLLKDLNIGFEDMLNNVMKIYRID